MLHIALRAIGHRSSGLIEAQQPAKIECQVLMVDTVSLPNK